MADSPFWMIWPGNAALSALIWFLIAMPFLYAARKPVHELLRAVGRLAGGPLRLASRWLIAVAEEMRERNKRRAARARARRGRAAIEREFERIGALVTRDLRGLSGPAAQAARRDHARRGGLQEVRRGAAAPARVGRGGRRRRQGEVQRQRAGAEILEEINRSIETIHEKTIGEYRRAYETRHEILKGFMPFWRSVDQTLAQADSK